MYDSPVRVGCSLSAQTFEGLLSVFGEISDNRPSQKSPEWEFPTHNRRSETVKKPEIYGTFFTLSSDDLKLNLNI